MTIRQFIWLAALFLIAVLLFALSPVEPQQAHINIIQIQDSINPGVEDFMKYAIKRSVDDKAECLIILLDTPGGLMTSMRGISQAILNSAGPNRRLCLSRAAHRPPPPVCSLRPRPILRQWRPAPTSGPPTRLPEEAAICLPP